MCTPCTLPLDPPLELWYYSTGLDVKICLRVRKVSRPFEKNGSQIRFKRIKHVYRSCMHRRPRLLTRDLILCQLNQIVDTSPVNRKKATMGDSVTSTGTLL